MCVYNGEDFVGEAVDSILAQTFDDFELIVINDGSTDDTAAVLASYEDPRVQIFAQSNQGIPKSRNRALQHARGQYIAVLDADDIAHPARLARQVDCLDAHAEVVALGSGYKQVDVLRDRTFRIIPPTADGAIRRAMITGNPICHSSVMMRRSALERVGSYDERFHYSQDYELWSRLAQVGELRNLPEVLVTRRYHSRSVSNNLTTEFLRLRLFWQASSLAVQRLGFPQSYRLLALRSIVLFLALDLYSAVKHWWQQRRRKALGLDSYHNC